MTQEQIDETIDSIEELSSLVAQQQMAKNGVIGQYPQNFVPKIKVVKARLAKALSVIPKGNVANVNVGVSEPK